MGRHRLVKFMRAAQGAVALGDAGLCLLLVWLVSRDAFRAPGRLALLVALWIVVLYAMGLYDFARFRNPRELESALCGALIVDCLLGTTLFPQRHAIVAGAVLAHAGLLPLRLAWLRMICSPWAAQSVAFLGDSPLIGALVSDMRAGTHPGYRVAQWRKRIESPLGAPALDRWAPLAQARWRSRRVSLLVIDSGLSLKDRGFVTAFTLAACGGVPTITDLELYELLYHKTAPRQAATADWLLAHVLPRRQVIYPFLKRLFDVAAAACGLVLLSPLMALSAVLAAWDGGQPIYRQRRAGLLGEEFTILKFRTMAPGADRRAPLTDAPNADPMMTRWGGFLRRFRLDELPQLWNVLKGDMSMIGPRPERPEAISILQECVPAYHLRHLVKPGLTGWAQINFRATNLPDGALEKLRYDLYYLKHLSPLLDLAILLRTVRRVFEPEQAVSAGPADAAAGELNDAEEGMA